MATDENAVASGDVNGAVADIVKKGLKPRKAPPIVVALPFHKKPIAGWQGAS